MRLEALSSGVFAARQRCFSALAIFIGLASFLSSSGCGVSNATPSVEKADINVAPLEIDAGVIFSDRSNYLCIPLDRFGLASADNIETIVSSCECVKPGLVRYSDSSTTAAVGVLFEFVSEEASSDSTPQLMQLGVVVTLTMKSGEIHTVIVNSLRAESTIN